MQSSEADQGAGVHAEVADLLEKMEGLELSGDLVVLNPCMGILVKDPTFRRLIEGAAIHLDLTPEMLTEQTLEGAALDTFELIVVDEALIGSVRRLLEAREEGPEHAHPALISVRSKAGAESQSESAGGMLILPQEPAAIVAQLGLLLYAHRAVARRYQSALEELHLNRRIFRSVTSGISVANATLPDMPLVYVNPAFEVMTGYSLEEVRGKNCRFLQAAETDQPGLTLVREALRAGREVVSIIKNFHKDGTSFWNELSLSPIRNRDGVLTHFVGIQNDVTARVEFEAALRESEKLAAVGRLAASIAHEINNPLESVMNLLYLARETENTVEAKNYLGQADRELQRVAQITSQSLRFYKQSTKAQAVRPTVLLEGVLELYSGRLANAGVTVERRERMTESIVCLESEIRQVLSNLVRNGMDAMPKGGRLRVRSREATDWPSMTTGVLITIADSGEGMSEETRRQIGKAFFTTKGIGGTGLGLWVSQEIVARHHGRLQVKSKVGSGTVFSLFLPYQAFAP